MLLKGSFRGRKPRRPRFRPPTLLLLRCRLGVIRDRRLNKHSLLRPQARHLDSRRRILTVLQQLQ
jgi:hypothetical protein